jgi:hypothetical protein
VRASLRHFGLASWREKSGEFAHTFSNELVPNDLQRDPDSLSRSAQIPAFPHATEMSQDHLDDFFPIFDHSLPRHLARWWHELVIFDDIMKYATATRKSG